MRRHSPTVRLDPASRSPAYLQIAAALVQEIRRGRLAPGDLLPGYRTLAATLRVSKNTVLAAYRELQSEGWITSAVGAGSTVSRKPPTVPGAPTIREHAPRPGFDLRGEAPVSAATPARVVLRLDSGLADPRHFPGAVLARAYRRALVVNPRAAVGGHESDGHPGLRQVLARSLAAARGIRATPERILVTRGPQPAFVLAAQALIAPGDAVAVEALGDRAAWDALARAGARCLPVPVDEEGLDVDALAALARRIRLRAVLVTPHRQVPTLASLGAERRTRLLELAAAERFAVLESDLDWEFQFEGELGASLLAEDHAGVVIHLGVLSRSFGPGQQLGLVHAAAGFVARMREQHLAFEREGDPVLERAMVELIEDGELERHLSRMHGVYRRRRDALTAALLREAGESVSIAPASGGLALWVKVRDGVDVDAWAARALARGVAFRPGRQFAFDGGAVQGFRIGFSSLAEPALDDAAARIGAALRDVA